MKLSLFQSISKSKSSESYKTLKALIKKKLFKQFDILFGSMCLDKEIIDNPKFIHVCKKIIFKYNDIMNISHNVVLINHYFTYYTDKMTHEKLRIEILSYALIEEISELWELIKWNDMLNLEFNTPESNVFFYVYLFRVCQTRNSKSINLIYRECILWYNGSISRYYNEYTIDFIDPNDNNYIYYEDNYPVYNENHIYSSYVYHWYLTSVVTACKKSLGINNIRKFSNYILKNSIKIKSVEMIRLFIRDEFLHFPKNKIMKRLLKYTDSNFMEDILCEKDNIFTESKLNVSIKIRHDVFIFDFCRLLLKYDAIDTFLFDPNILFDLIKSNQSFIDYVKKYNDDIIFSHIRDRYYEINFFLDKIDVFIPLQIFLLPIDVYPNIKYLKHKAFSKQWKIIISFLKNHFPIDIILTIIYHLL